MSPLLIAGVAAAVAGWALTALVRRYALERAMLDIPNERSAHTTPMPRGGGLAIAIVSLGGILASGIAGWIPRDWTFALVGGGVVTAAIGWLDDRHSVPSVQRVLVHLAAAGWAVYWLGGLPTLTVGSTIISLGPAGSGLAVLGLVAAINLYNFMDGIDGFAGSEAVVAGGAAVVLLALTGAAPLALTTLFPVAACLGFLFWNWPPARIFMGDVGSGLLGFLFGVLALLSERGGGPPFVVWLVLFGGFAFDATVTLLRRMSRAEHWWQAHRSHGYQRLAQSGWSHAAIGLALMALNLCLAALAWVMITRPERAAAYLGVAVLLLAAVYIAIERAFPMSSGGSPS